MPSGTPLNRRRRRDRGEKNWLGEGAGLVDFDESAGDMSKEERDRALKRIVEEVLPLVLGDRLESVVFANRRSFEWLMTPRTRSYLRYDPRADLLAIKQPICVIAGTQDGLIPFEITATIATELSRHRKNPKDDFYPLLGLNHAFCQGNEMKPGEVDVPDIRAIDAIAAFVESVSTERSR